MISLFLPIIVVLLNSRVPLSAAMKIMIPTTTMTSSISTATKITWMVFLFISIVFASSSSTVFAFTTVPSTTKIIQSAKVGAASRSLLPPSLSSSQLIRLVPLVSLLATSSSSSSSDSGSNVDHVVVVISPPGGIGEMTSIEAARLGGTVKWFVVSAPDTNTSTNADTKSANAYAFSSSSSSGKQISLTAETLTAIEKAGGSLELAGASADSLLQLPASSGILIGGSNSASSSSLTAMASWCANSSCIISTYDFGTATTLPSLMRMRDINNNNNLNKNSIEGDETTMMICAAIRLATKEAVLGMRRMQPTTTAEAVESSDGGDNNSTKKKVKKNVMIAILPTGVEEEDSVTDKNNNNINNEASSSSSSSGGLFGLDFFGGKDKNELVVPTTLMDAIGKQQQHGVGGIVIRYGELFGAPESSPESSPFLGGPKRDPVVRDMYTMRSVRMDPTIFSTSSSSSSSSLSSGMTFKSNRLAVAEAVSRLGMGMLDSMNDPTSISTSLDVTLSSFAGTEKPSDDEWNAEFGRVASELMSSSSSVSRDGINVGGIQQQQRRHLFRAEFASVPSTKRLAEWIATKWAPAVLRSYDIAGIRVGARPVYALLQSTTTTNDGTDVHAVEIVWQKLVDFNSVTSGKMIIEVGESGMMAWRGAGDATKGFGLISSSPLPGEEILVRRLADAASQAIEKGLAVKPRSAKKAEGVVSKQPVTTVVVDEVIVDTVVTSLTEPADVLSLSSNGGPGPRSGGARRSSERSRGSRKVTPSQTLPTEMLDGDDP